MVNARNSNTFGSVQEVSDRKLLWLVHVKGVFGWNLRLKNKRQRGVDKKIHPPPLATCLS